MSIAESSSWRDRPGAPLGDEVVDRLVRAGTRRRYPSGALIFAEGDPAGPAFLVTAGVVSLRVGAADDPEIGSATVGGLIGELSAVDGLPRSASAVAVTDVEVVAVPPATFGELLAEVPALALHLLGAVAGRLRQATQHRAAAVGGLPVGHLARRLLVEIGPVRPGERVELTATRLAGDLEVSSEMLSRALDHLAAEGGLAFERGSIVVLDVSVLRREAEVEAR